MQVQIKSVVLAYDMKISFLQIVMLDLSVCKKYFQRINPPLQGNT